MKHPDHRAQFLQHYKNTIGDNPPPKSQRMAKQCEIANQLYAEQPDEVKAKIAAENVADKSARVSAFKKLLSGKGFMLEEVGSLTEQEKML